MNRQEKIQALESRLNALTAPKPVSLTEQLITEELENLRADIGNRVSTRAIEKVQGDFASFSEKFKLEPVFEAITKADSANKTALQTLQKGFDKRISDLSKSLIQQSKEGKRGTIQSFQGALTQIEALRQSFETESQTFLSRDMLLASEVDRIRQEVRRIELRFSGEISGIDTTTPLAATAALKKELIELEKRVYSRISGLNNHGGNMNRNIAINGNTSVLSKYTDINWKAGSNVTLTPVVNNTTKYTDITITASGGGGSFAVMVPTGTVNGVNTIFTFISAPSVVVLDNGNVMNQVSSDGTVNWTGTTVVTLTQAPNFNIYGF